MVPDGAGGIHVSAGASTTMTPGGLDLVAVQGLLAVQQLGGWLLFDRDGQDPISASLVAPAGRPQRAWFYLIPASGQPTLIAHQAEVGAFAAVPGKLLPYRGTAALDAALGAALRGVKSVAMQYSPKAALPTMSRVDAGTLELVRGKGVKVVGADSLVQATKARWSPQARLDHAVAAHHLGALRAAAVAFIAERLAAGAPVTEWDVARHVAAGMAVRGLVGPSPRIAAGVNSADPEYAPGPRRAAAIRPGDVVTIGLAGKLEADTAVYAALTWVAFVGVRVPDAVARTFDIASLARDRAVALITERVSRRRAIKGLEADAAAREFVATAGLADRFLHRTGHSLDRDLFGAGANLDGLEVDDARPLVAGTGFTIGPGLYLPGQFGVRAEVSAYLGPDGLELTTPAQQQVELIAPGPR
ncbi:MAG: M24 family metallopeptidase [Kofleriaceae bacterium]